ncbi:MAG TPA: phosphoenolpyruvate carboxykinase (ATP), partial [Rubrobacteraceae bacterium]|nr:phosphoenolpyruvate carboxykinase (ATP) [Rubrobacteraceae bacterium]
MDTTVRKRVLERLGLSDLKSVRENLSPAMLVEESLRRGEAALSDSGALVAETGERTGRSPVDRFIVETAVTKGKIDWGEINKPFPSDKFEQILDRAADYVRNLDELYVVDAYAGADPRYRLNVQIVAEWAWHALFARQLFRRPTPEELESFEPEWTVISVPGFGTVPERDGTNSETFIGLDFERKVVLVCASGYAGEMKKSIFTVLNFVLPVEHGVLPMHCSANVGEEDDVALFFGLSGTGKTTISTDEKRRLIGDDE